MRCRTQAGCPLENPPDIFSGLFWLQVGLDMFLEVIIAHKTFATFGADNLPFTCVSSNMSQ